MLAVFFKCFQCLLEPTNPQQNRFQAFQEAFGGKRVLAILSYAWIAFRRLPGLIHEAHFGMEILLTFAHGMLSGAYLEPTNPQQNGFRAFQEAFGGKGVFAILSYAGIAFRRLPGLIHEAHSGAITSRTLVLSPLTSPVSQTGSPKLG